MARRAEGLRGLLDHGDPLLRSQSDDDGKVGGMPEQVDRRDRRNGTASDRVGCQAVLGAAVASEEPFELGGVELPVVRVDVEGDGVAADVADRV
jgi:hypothetical protein